MKCKSKTAYKCPKCIKVVFDMGQKTIKLMDPLGWEHHHKGTLQLTRGLPPDIKISIKDKLEVEPHMKPRALMNYLVDSCGYPITWRTQVNNYVVGYKRKSSISMFGISSYGAAMTLISDRVGIDTVLSGESPTIDSVGVIGHYLDPDTNRLLALSSSIRLIMHGHLEETDGYSQGHVYVDFTFKVLKEKIPMMVFSVADIAQHGHVLSFGPSTHEDDRATEMGAAFVKDFLQLVLRSIHSRQFPVSWSSTLIKEIIDTYGSKVQPNCVVWGPKFGLADCADGLLNGVEKALDTMKTKLSCWAHIWRFVMKKCTTKMIDTSQTKVDKLFEALSFMHEVPYIDGVDMLMVKSRLIDLFKLAWSDEPELVAYLEHEVLGRKFSKCDSEPGKPGNTNTLERFNLEFKGANYFSSTEGLATYLVRTLTIGIRISRDSRPWAMCPPIPGKDWVSTQKLVSKGWQNLGYKFTLAGKETLIFPSEKLIDGMPTGPKTVRPCEPYTCVMPLTFFCDALGGRAT